MLVRNLTQSSLNMKSVSGKRIALPPMKVVEIDGIDFPAERIKKLFGRYVQILTEKAEVTTNDVPTEAKQDMESKEDLGNVQPADETVAKEEGNEAPSGEDNSEDVVVEDAGDDSDNADQLVDSIIEEVEKEDAGEENAVVEEPKEEEKPAPKKRSKKASKK